MHTCSLQTSPSSLAYWLHVAVCVDVIHGLSVAKKPNIHFPSAPSSHKDRRRRQMRGVRLMRKTLRAATYCRDASARHTCRGLGDDDFVGSNATYEAKRILSTAPQRQHEREPAASDAGASSSDDCPPPAVDSARRRRGPAVAGSFLT